MGKAPLLKMIDDQIRALRDKIAAVQNARDAAAARKNSAREKVDRVPEDEKRVMAEAEDRAAREAAELEAAHQLRLEIMQRELEDRKQEERHAALMRVKAELVDHAVDEVLRRYQESHDDALQAALIDGFTAEMESMRS